MVTAVYVSYVSTATVGNRQIRIDVLDAAAAVKARVTAGTTQAASLTRTYTAGLGLGDAVAFVDGNLTISLPQMVLGPAESIRIYDSAAIAAAADDVVMRVSYMARAV
jgi:hypothetical protein